MKFLELQRHLKLLKIHQHHHRLLFHRRHHLHQQQQDNLLKLGLQLERYLIL
jgi:hypothetical protein